MIPTDPVVKEAAWSRSGGRCEALWPYGEDTLGPARIILHTPDGMVRAVARCTAEPVDPHHRLPAGRGGRLLEAPYPQIVAAVCSACHRRAHGRELGWADDGAGQAYGVLLIPGEVLSHPSGIVYRGTDHELTTAINKE